MVNAGDTDELNQRMDVLEKRFDELDQHSMQLLYDIYRLLGFVESTLVVRPPTLLEE